MMAAGLDLKLIAVMILGILTNDADCVGTRRLCGRELADALALICQGRGYNVAFKPQGDFRGDRYKRGIVDECCRRGCLLKTLESYCSEARPSDKDTLQISKRSELSSREIQTTFHSGRKPDENLPLDNFIRHSKSRKLRPLLLVYLNKYQSGDPTERIDNLDLRAVKHKSTAGKSKKKEKLHNLGEITKDISFENEPLDTSEIMAEVVESSPESSDRIKRDSEASRYEDIERDLTWQANEIQPFYLSRMLLRNSLQ